MRHRILILLLILIPGFAFGQHIISGNYDYGLTIAFDDKTGKLTGCFEDYSGWNEELKIPQFSCVFYIEGKSDSGKFILRTYYPGDEKTEMIPGIMETPENAQLKIKLTGNHGGCWNVQFSESDTASFTLAQSAPWIQVRYVVAEKTFFYADKNTSHRLKSYIVKNDFVCVDKIDGEWVHATFYGEKTTSGWVLGRDLNSFE